MRFNLTVGGELSVEDSILLDKLFCNFHGSFSKLIEGVIYSNYLKETDLISSVISRNPFHTSLVELLLKLFLLNEKLIRKHDIKEIFVENGLLYKPVRQLLKKHKINANIKTKNRFFTVNIFKRITINFFKSLFLILLNLRFKSLIKSNFNSKKEIVLVDIFVFPDSFSNSGVFCDRYFSGFNKFLSSNEAKKIVYAPTIYGVRSFSDIKRIAEGAQKSITNFIFQEEYLGIYDYLNSLFTTFKNFKKIRSVPDFMGLDIQKIFLFESKKDVFNPSMMVAISKFYFSRHLSFSELNIKHVVDWYENQSLDKAFILGVKRFLKVKVIGYQGFVPPLFEMHKFPESFEYEKGLLPDKLFTISKSTLESIRFFCPTLNVSLANAYRFSNLKDVKINNQRSSILIALPMDLFEARKIIKICLKFLKFSKFKNKVLVKNHPANKLTEILTAIPELKKNNFLIKEQPIVELYTDAKVLITSASSTAVEALYLNIPVAIYGNRTGATMNPIESFNTLGKSVVFYNSSQLYDFIFLKKDNKVDNSDIFFWDDGESTKEIFGKLP